MNVGTVEATVDVRVSESINRLNTLINKLGTLDTSLGGTQSEVKKFGKDFNSEMSASVRNIVAGARNANEAINRLVSTKKTYVDVSTRNLQKVVRDFRELKITSPNDSAAPARASVNNLRHLASVEKAIQDGRYKTWNDFFKWEDYKERAALNLSQQRARAKAQAYVDSLNRMGKAAEEFRARESSALRDKVVGNISASQSARTASHFGGAMPVDRSGGMAAAQSYLAARNNISSLSAAIRGIRNPLEGMYEGFRKVSIGATSFLIPSKEIQDTLAGWWQHFGRIGLGFGAIYGALRAVSAAARYAFSIFIGGIKVMDDIRSSGAMVAGMLALVTKNGKTFADNYSAYFANFTKVIGRVTTLLPQYGLTMEQFIAGTRELAQFGVVVDNDNLKESIISMKLIQEIAANTKQDTRQIRQELQAFFSGQARMSDQFARTVNNSMPELAKAIEKIRNEGGTTQEMWAKLSTEMFKMEPSIKAANMNLGVQHEVLKANLSVISALALEATGLYDIWLNGLQAFNDSLFTAKGGLTDFGKQVYRVFFKAWEWTKEWGQVLLGLGQIVFAFVVKPFILLFDVLSDIKDTIVAVGQLGLGNIFQGMDLLKEGKYAEAGKLLASTVDNTVTLINDGFLTVNASMERNKAEFEKVATQGAGNIWYGLGAAFTDNFVALTGEQEGKIGKAITGLLAPGGKADEKAVKEAANIWGAAWSDALNAIKFEKLDKVDYKIDADIQTPYYDAIKAYNEKMAEDFKLTFLKIRLEADSFGNYLGGSFKGLFDSVFKHEVTSFAQFFTGALKSIQDAFSSMLSDMVSEYFTAMMRMQFQKGAADMMGNWFGSFIGGSSNITLGGTNWTQGASGNLMNRVSPVGGSYNLGTTFPTASIQNYSGGMINEPVFGVGMSGKTYSFAERGPERVLSNSESKKYGKGDAPQVTINFSNESGTPLTATQGGMQFDGEKYVTSIIVKQMSTNPSFRSNMRG